MVDAINFGQYSLLKIKTFQYFVKTERIAPNWTMIIKLFTNSVLGISKKKPVIIIWPVEDMGKNSLNPSTIDNKKTLNQDIGFNLNRIVGQT